MLLFLFFKKTYISDFKFGLYFAKPAKNHQKVINGVVKHSERNMFEVFVSIIRTIRTFSAYCLHVQLYRNPR